MIKNTSQWKPVDSFANHATLKQRSVRQNVEESEAPPAPPIDTLKPGECLNFEAGWQPTPPKISWTEDDRIEFRNGGRIEDKPNEGNLLITAPDGSQSEVTGWIDMDYDKQQPSVFFRTFDKVEDEWITWQQTFPAEGGTVLQKGAESYKPELTIQVGPKGQVEARDSESDSGYSARLQGKAVVVEFGSQGYAMVPPAPVEWFVTK